MRQLEDEIVAKVFVHIQTAMKQTGIFFLYLFLK
jgi:hypothetical protein